MTVTFFQAAGLFILLIYSLLILAFFKGWRKLPVYELRKHTLPAYMSIVVPVRNEAINIIKLLYALKRQNYDQRCFRVIIVDDHSTDSTREHIKIFRGKHPQMNIILKWLPDGKTSKKQALKAGVAQAKGDALIFMDADGLPGPDYLRIMNEYYRKDRPAMLLGPIAVHGGSNLFDRLQALEFLSLIFSTAGAAGMQKPIMANGASLLMDMQVLQEYHNDDPFKDDLASGDDMFLLHHVKKYLGSKRISFVRHPGAIIKTCGAITPAAFREQRKRWVSKSTAYRDPFLIFVAITVWLMAVVQATSLGAGAINPNLLYYTAIIWGVKIIVDIVALLPVTRFTGQKNLRKYILLLTLMHPFYILFTSFSGWLFPYRWKGRKHKR